MEAYLNKPELKQEVLAEMQEHIDADRLIKGKYWEDGKGCAVGCLIKSDEHSEYEIRFGIPEQLAQLEDSIFEGLPNEKAMQWPIRFLNAFEVGKDHSKVWNHFAVWLLIDPDVGVIRHADEKGKAAINRVAELHQNEIHDKPEGDAAWNAARSAAWDAARAAACEAAGTAAWYAACDAAGVATWYAARDTAMASAWAAAGDAAWYAAYERMADKLIELIEQV